MAKRPGQKITMTRIDELLCVPDTEGTIDIDVEVIYPFENHPFKVLDDERMEELTESIRANGILTPVLVRPDDEGTYEMISGHRRLEKAEKFIYMEYFIIEEGKFWNSILDILKRKAGDSGFGNIPEEMEAEMPFR